MGERGLGFLFRPSYKDRHGKTKKASIWWWRVSLHGRKYAMATGKKTRPEALAWAIAKLAEMQKGDLSALTATKLTLPALQKLVQDDYTVNGRRAKEQVSYAYSRLREALGDRILARELTTVRLKAYVAARLEEGYAGATINLDLAFLQRGINLAARDGLILPRPRGWLPTVKVSNARQGFFERGAFQAVLAHIPEVLRGALTVAYITGWRFDSEILTREWRHVDLKAGWMRLEPGEGKTGEGRMFPLTPELRTVLEAARAYTDEVQRDLGRIVPWVFHRRGRKIGTVRREWDAARKAAGMPGALLHDFRRTAARNMERAGVSRSAAKRLIGHRTDVMYARYAIVDEAVLREGAEKLAALHETQRSEAATVVAMKKD